MSEQILEAGAASVGQPAVPKVGINQQSFSEKLKSYRRTPGSFLLLLLVILSAVVTLGVLFALIIYILVKGIPNIRPELFALEYTTDNVSMLPAMINTLIMTVLSLLMAVPLGIFSAIYTVEYAKRGNKLVGIVRVTAEGEPAVRDYLRFLSGGCSKDPVSLLKDAGVDMMKPDAINVALALFGELVEEMDALMSEKD